MKKYLIILFLFCFFFSFAQDVHVENGIAYIGDKPYVKIIKKNKKDYFIYDLKTNTKIIKVQLSKKYNERSEKYDPETKFYFLKLDTNAAFSEIKATSATDIAELLFSKNLILPNGALNTELAKEYHETTPVGKRCLKMLKNDYAGVLYHKFRPVVGNDTLQINEVKFECVITSFYTKKVLYDRFGMWHKEIYRNPSGRIPELLWKDIQLFEDDEKKFTVVARGVETPKTIYASIMVFDDNNYDMLHKNSPYRDKIVALFGEYIKTDTDDRKFYEVFWKRYDPERWQQILAHNKPTNSKGKPPHQPSKPNKN
ncbi:MAG: hypothetical protein AAF611_14125 [Bacteroidota bacterium]